MPADTLIGAHEQTSASSAKIDEPLASVSWTLRIDGLSVEAIVGVHPRERTEQRSILLDISIEFDGRRGAETDHISETIDYKEVRDRILAAIQGREFNLIERIASEVIRVLAADLRIAGVSVVVNKPNGLRLTRGVEVEAGWKRSAVPAK